MAGGCVRVLQASDDAFFFRLSVDGARAVRQLAFVAGRVRIADAGEAVRRTRRASEKTCARNPERNANANNVQARRQGNNGCYRSTSSLKKGNVHRCLRRHQHRDNEDECGQRTVVLTVGSMSLAIGRRARGRENAPGGDQNRGTASLEGSGE